MTTDDEKIKVAKEPKDVWLEPLRRDLRQAASLLSLDEIRFLVDVYYDIQKLRIGSGHQKRTLSEDAKPPALLGWVADSMNQIEHEIRLGLDRWTSADRTAAWAKSIHGIGPVIAAGLRSYVDVKIATNPSKVWRFFGLDPTVRWGKGEKRPYCAGGKVLAWKIGESFVRLRGFDGDVYGKVYEARKKLELERDERGDFAAQAAETLSARKIRDPATRRVYESGHLPAGRLDLRARRVAIKLFLSHYWAVAYEVEFGRRAPRAWSIEHGGHTGLIDPPNW